MADRAPNSEFYLDGCWIDGALKAGAIGLTLLISAVLRVHTENAIRRERL
jgi:hypothetical protein